MNAGGINHLGVETTTADEVTAADRRLTDSGLTTTGATANEAARVLLDAGAASVTLAVLAFLSVFGGWVNVPGAIRESFLGGMGAAYWLRATRGWEWLTPLHGAVAAALGGALLLGLARA